MKLIWGEDRSASVIHSSEPFFFHCSEKCEPLSELFSAAAPCASYSTPHTQKNPSSRFPEEGLSYSSLSCHFAEGGGTLCTPLGKGCNEFLLLNQPEGTAALRGHCHPGNMTLIQFKVFHNEFVPF